MSLLLLNEDELRQIVTISEAIDAVQTAFSALAEGRMNVPGDFSMSLPEVKGEVQVQGTYLNQAPYYVINISSYFQANPDLNLPHHSGLTCVFHASTGLAAAIMVDNGYLSTIRAAAAGALAADYLANKQIEHVAVIGSGYRAYMQLKSLMTVRRISTVSVWATTMADTDNYVNSMIDDYELDIRLAPSLEAAVRGADLIITVDGGREASIKVDWLKPGVHITSVGCNGFLKQELDVAVLIRADVIITDDFDQCANFGEIRNALASNTITKDDVQGDLGDLIIGKIPGRTHPDQITVADLTGLEVQDTVVATQALQKALFLGLGQRVAEPAMSRRQ